ncbi:hypothetical protein TVAG_484420 [Trichomonas vaginalis G3]|uniref:Uncharacterized protein n=1 Tax=Trichomonas vaginalis (strain ATCC PRA-98 / G3) TaxID=412133 RepID=A2FUJ5_TRIV3|nr:sulfurtransferase-related family [Trichomonas vaginalis G3]EAX91428.1 hypothetical protein TVAG_484420 [Trichomonas vaginalis G3]KAI5486949.1 sulfurtransferase-related family [Trichomonas vaginalis G3]|eukprot:XP_001304358.1 hypothetical protein [Trichomonas vaginalis G3]
MLNSIKKKSAMTCSEFHLFDLNDKVIIPIDADGKKLPLACWMHFKAEKTKPKIPLLAIHFYSTPHPDPQTKLILDEFCNKYKLDIKYVHHKEVTNRDELYNMYIEQAMIQGYNKIAIPDTIEAINAAMLAKMCDEGVLDAPDPKQEFQINDNTSIYLIRPFCYCSNKNIEEYAQKNSFKVHPGGINPPNENSLDASTDALNILYKFSPNVSVNFFHSQFHVEEKYLGGGDGAIHEMMSFDENT